jgi:hybrid cluster-associated redox disulfide protein
MKTIKKEMTIAEILAVDPMIANILSGQGMNCIFCGGAENETLEEACAVHGIDRERVELLVAQMNDFLGVPQDEAE